MKLVIQGKLAGLPRFQGNAKATGKAYDFYKALVMFENEMPMSVALPRNYDVTPILPFVGKDCSLEFEIKTAGFSSNDATLVLASVSKAK